MNCDTSSLVASSTCFSCLPEKVLQAIKVFLFCALANKPAGGNQRVTDEGEFRTTYAGDDRIVE